MTPLARGGHQLIKSRHQATGVEMHTEPIMDLAHLGHLELLTPKPEESLHFFVDVLGMTETGREANSVYLHAYDDYERHSLKLTASKLPGLGHVAYRTRSPQALERRVAALKGSGFDIGWTDGDLAHGPAFLCQDPDGHKIELYYETQWYQAPPELGPALKNQAQRFPARGANVRRLDHWNGLAVDIKANREFFEKYLGFRLTEQIVLDNGTEAAMWMTCTNKSYDFAYTHDHTVTRGRFHRPRAAKSLTSGGLGNPVQSSGSNRPARHWRPGCHRSQEHHEPK
jgi:catechol 2,3-dioxygenase-like lactoylglutathione lyase family enzyme